MLVVLVLLSTELLKYLQLARLPYPTHPSIHTAQGHGIYLIMKESEMISPHLPPPQRRNNRRPPFCLPLRWSWTAPQCSATSQANKTCLHQATQLSNHGQNQADRPQVHRREGPQEAAGHQGCQEVCPRHRRSQEAPQVPARHCGSQGDQALPEVH